MTTEAGQRLGSETATGDFEPEQKRYLEGFAAGLQIAKTAKGFAGSAAARRRRAGGRADRPRRRGAQGAGSRARRRRQALGSGEVQARRASVRHLRAAQGPGHAQRISEAAGQFPLALLRPVLCGAEPELLHVPAAHAERHSQSAAVRRRRRSRRALRRRLRARHDARQSAGARDRSQERGRHDRRRAGPGAVLARLRRRQYPQRHRRADRRHRSARN